MNITLKSCSAIATISTHGAELTSFKDIFGKEYIWCGDPKYWNRHSPVLFPIVGNLENGKVMIDGKDYSIPKHGFARDLEFKLLYRTDAKAIFCLTSNNETLKMYPYKFTLQITYELLTTNLEITYDVVNIDNKPIKYCLGTHPAFNCPLNENEKFEDYVIEFNQNEIGLCPKYDYEKNHININDRVKILDNKKSFNLDYSLFSIDALIFDNIKSDKVMLYNKISGRGVELEYKNFDYIAIWTNLNNKAPFVCLEPWVGMSKCSDEDNNFENKRGVKTLKIDEKNTYKLIVKPL